MLERRHRAARARHAGVRGLRRSRRRARARPMPRRRTSPASFCATSMRDNATNFRIVRPGRDDVEPPRCGLRGDRSRLRRRALAARRPRLAGRARDGSAERAPVPGVARRLPAHRAARLLLVLRSVHPHRRLDVQPAREVAEVDPRDPVAAADRVAQLSAHLARVAAGPQRASAIRIPGSSITS